MKLELTDLKINSTLSVTVREKLWVSLRYLAGPRRKMKLLFTKMGSLREDHILGGGGVAGIRILGIHMEIYYR